MTDVSGPSVVVVSTPSRHRWQWWRDLVNLALAVAVICLVAIVVRSEAQITGLQRQLTATTALRAEQVEQLTTDLARLQRSLDSANRLTAARDAEIRRLTLLVVQLGGDPAPPVVVRVPSGPTPSPTPGVSARPSARRSSPASPRPVRTFTAAAPTPPQLTPSPSRTPTCLLALCIPRSSP